MCEPAEDLITVGSYVVIKKQNFKKLYKVTEDGNLWLGKDNVKMREINGKRFWTTFEMIPQGGKSKAFTLKEASEAESWDDLLSSLPSGNDNRSITDDGTSQKLSKDEILQLQESGKTGKEIVGSLIENSKSFLDKTEYSQEKYLKKKEKKYCKYFTICKPQISSLQDIYFKLDQNKHGIMRMETLAQLLSYCDVQSEGLYLVYNSGYQGLPVAAMLNRIGANTKGHLINLHPGNMTQGLMVQAMNFPKEQLGRLVNVNIYSFLRLHYQGDSVILNNISKRNNLPNKIKETENISNSISSQNLENNETSNKVADENGIADELRDESTDDNKIVNENRIADELRRESTDDNKIENENRIAEELPRESSEENKIEDENHIVEEVRRESGEKNNIEDVRSANNSTNVLKRKLDELNEETVTAKKPKWLLETQRAVDLLQDGKARGLAIVAKEHPLNIINGLLPFLGVSRPFVIYHAHREPLQETYVHLKQRQNVINLRLFSNFLRSYQVLPDRTHPDIVTSDTGGYLLTGYLVE